MGGFRNSGPPPPPCAGNIDFELIRIFIVLNFGYCFVLGGG